MAANGTDTNHWYDYVRIGAETRASAITAPGHVRWLLLRPPCCDKMDQPSEGTVGVAARGLDLDRQNLIE